MRLDDLGAYIPYALRASKLICHMRLDPGISKRIWHMPLDLLGAYGICAKMSLSICHMRLDHLTHRQMR